ncbi:hypothetical protein CcaverHIS002_0312460 [Cutaneotrichosporon cavernicola]|nr:hypothetical protein CcaverHIS002_0312460 [Cutaneotrichosporon cavernicola]
MNTAGLYLRSERHEDLIPKWTDAPMPSRVEGRCFSSPGLSILASHPLSARATRAPCSAVCARQCGVSSSEGRRRTVLGRTAGASDGSSVV